MVGVCWGLGSSEEAVFFPRPGPTVSGNGTEPFLQGSFCQSALLLVASTHLTSKADLKLDLRQVTQAHLGTSRSEPERKRMSTELRVDRTEVWQGLCLDG